MLIKKYTTNWINDFNDLKNEIEKGLGELNYSIEHVGSTSIPNLDAKPIIDIDIIYQDKLEFEKIKMELIDIGYYHNGDQGIESREVFKRNEKYMNPILDKISHHLYVCLKYSKGLERHILSRDYMKKNDWARLKYQKMKYELAEKANQNKKVYAQLKELNINNFIDEIIYLEKNKDRNIDEK
ncbi:GrpB domain, predicted nucleotidyltransferase, UPF0157 family [Aquimarina amphilecti]|uniref:GrpB domain, predicted nucleotidyltransferase, UPF0157 family n=1 Tax=Aquimarina amphilecti TaxID=1038014 RepID=A0A1H7QML4_AQUAM|nr:GrpB family protein [Aquimarina amphilecti]SEL49119.1 GrpB domain, predicted nucleotidyltransferase, UPF0157 family [Aquimarina amphilecti]